jgi:uncharacterized protein with ParB-like and HNH nuclease domain
VLGELKENMSQLESRIAEVTKEIVKDGYDMSVGEVISLYKDGELDITPAYQRYYRWDQNRKTKFIESLLIGIPIPPVFVYQMNSGKWELIDGLQRISTILEFFGELKDENSNKTTPLVLTETKLLPELKDQSINTISQALKLSIKRSRIRVEILKKESDQNARYELFVRLNTGGQSLSDQEVRSCLLEMTNPTLFTKLRNSSENASFLDLTQFTETASSKQKDVEYVIRFLVLRNCDYKAELDVNEYFDDAIIEFGKNTNEVIDSELSIFARTTELLARNIGPDCFKRRSGSSIKGAPLASAFEAITLGVSKHIDYYEKNTEELLNKINRLWQQEWFLSVAKPGTRGTTRIKSVKQFSEAHFHYEN